MEETLKYTHHHFSSLPIVLNAQSHLQGYYHRHGFIAEGEEFLEDGIPHITMKKDIPT